MNQLDAIIYKITAKLDDLKLIRKEADDYAASHDKAAILATAHKLYESDKHQARILATILLGRLAAHSPDALSFMRSTVSQDEEWRVQEVLAMAFDNFCKDTGYEASLPTIRSWLKDTNPRVRRAATEGLRIWTSRDYFKTHPAVAVGLLSNLKAGDSAYVRKSAGNALRDISKKYPELVKAEVEGWDVADQRVAETFKYAAKFLQPIPGRL